MSKKNIWKVVGTVFLIQGIGFIGGLSVTKDALLWYDSLEKSPYSPPNWLFSWVWIFLYSVLGVVAYHLYEQRKKMGIIWYVFLFHIAANATWTYCFFQIQNISKSTFHLAVIVITLAFVMRWLYEHKSHLFNYLIPYALWLCYASYLQWYIWQHVTQ